MTQCTGDGGLCLSLGWAEKGLNSFSFLPAAATTVFVPTQAGLGSEQQLSWLQVETSGEVQGREHHLGLKGLSLSENVSLGFSF